MKNVFKWYVKSYTLNILQDRLSLADAGTGTVSTSRLVRQARAHQILITLTPFIFLTNHRGGRMPLPHFS